MTAVAAMSQNRVIGYRGNIPWHLPEDFKWFKRLTMGGVLLMGRKTFESIRCKPLPNRINVVLSRSATFLNVTTIPNLTDFNEDDYDAEVFVIGGAEVYRQLLPRCSDLFLTVVKKDVEGDTMFPRFEDQFSQVAVVKDTSEFAVQHFRNRDLLYA